MIKNKLLKLLSYFSKKPIITGQGFTTSDDSIPDTVKIEKIKVQPNLVRYRLDQELDFILIGINKRNTRVVYELKCVQTKETVTVDERLFKLFFRKH